MESKDLWFCLICWPTILKSFEGGSKYIFLLSVSMSGRGKELHGCFTVKGKDFKVHCIPLNASENVFFICHCYIERSDCFSFHSRDRL